MWVTEGGISRWSSPAAAVMTVFMELEDKSFSSVAALKSPIRRAPRPYCASTTTLQQS